MGYILSVHNNSSTLDKAISSAKETLERDNQTVPELYVYKLVGKVKRSVTVTFEEVKE